MSASATAVVYEVNLDLDADIADAYRGWLALHVAQISALPGFLGARVFRVRDLAPVDGRIALCVQYALRDQDALDVYLRDHAPRLRADGIDRFGEHVRASRRVLHEIAVPARIDRRY